MTQKYAYLFVSSILRSGDSEFSQIFSIRERNRITERVAM